MSLTFWMTSPEPVQSLRDLSWSRVGPRWCNNAELTLSRFECSECEQVTAFLILPFLYRLLHIQCLMFPMKWLRSAQSIFQRSSFSYLRGSPGICTNRDATTQSSQAAKSVSNSIPQAAIGYLLSSVRAILGSIALCGGTVMRNHRRNLMHERLKTEIFELFWCHFVSSGLITLDLRNVIAAYCLVSPICFMHLSEFRLIIFAEQTAFPENASLIRNSATWIRSMHNHKSRGRKQGENPSGDRSKLIRFSVPLVTRAGSDSSSFSDFHLIQLAYCRRVRTHSHYRSIYTRLIVICTKFIPLYWLARSSNIPLLPVGQWRRGSSEQRDTQTFGKMFC
jgi:hypothetical protein